MEENNANGKTIIGVLTSHDDDTLNFNIRKLFNGLGKGKNKKILRQFQFVFTGGTFERTILDSDGKQLLDGNLTKFIIEQCGVTKLPGFREGGVTILSYLITQRQCNILWPFYSPKEHHWRRPENQAQMRLSDQWHVKRLMNIGSVEKWFAEEAEQDIQRNLQSFPPEFILRPGDESGAKALNLRKHKIGFYEIDDSELKFKEFPTNFKDMTIALIAHDEMKNSMISFAIDHEWELGKFGTILATGTTGREVAAHTSRLLEEKIYRYHSGPKGGDIEIATEILCGRCHIVIFFVDPLNPHPHMDDIRTVFEACMTIQDVIIITNEMHAREFMMRVVRGKEGF